MKSSQLILIIASLVVLAAITYMFTAAESPEDYIEKIETERERQFKYIRFNIESPLTEEQKQGLQSLTFYPIDPGYRVKARLLPIEIKKSGRFP